MEKMFDIAVWRDGAKRPEKLSVKCKQTSKPNVWVGHCPLGTHKDNNPSFFVYEDDKQWHCYGCPGDNNHGALWDDTYYNINGNNGKKRKWGKLVEEYPYPNESGETLKVVERREDPKEFPVKRPDPNNKGKWIHDQKGIPEILYNLPALVKRPKDVIALVEGERIANRLNNDYGILTTTTAGGANRPYDEANNKYFKDSKGVALFPDNNEVGFKFMEDRGDAILKVNTKVKWIDLPGLKPDEDLGDWLDEREKGMSKEEIKTELKGLIKYGNMFPLHKLIKEKILNKIKESIPITERERVTLREAEEANIPETEMLISGGLVPKMEGFGIIGGETKEGKTIFSLEMSLCLISGNPFLEDFPIKKKRVVAYIYHENKLKGLLEYIRQQEIGFANAGTPIKTEDKDNLHLIRGKKMTFGLSLEDSELGNLIEGLKEIKPDVIFLDPLMQFVGFGLNDTKNIKRFEDLMYTIYPCFWILVHHYVKPRTLQKGESSIPPIYKILGSSYLGNACETFIGMEREGDNYSEEYKIIDFTVRHKRTPIPMHLYRNPDTLRYEVLDSGSIKRGKMSLTDIVKVLEESFGDRGASHKDLTRLCEREYGIKPANFDRLLRDAKEAGMVFKDERSRKGHWYSQNPSLL